MLQEHADCLFHHDVNYCRIRMELSSFIIFTEPMSYSLTFESPSSSAPQESAQAPRSIFPREPQISPILPRSRLPRDPQMSPTLPKSQLPSEPHKSPTLPQVFPRSISPRLSQKDPTDPNT
mmetsp:Transcript_905/g.1240  ORF Transcript_905/g.1240 Transcript_905/m.1240 type:complete len:121 (+) Transcript_905:67-429(+)